MNILRTATLVAIFIKCVTASTDVTPSQDDLVKAASRPELMCSPDDLFKILRKIEKQEDQELAIFRGVWNLFNLKRTECFDPLLKAFESSKSFKHLQAVAVKWAFRRGSFHGNKSIVERFHAHPAVTKEDRADGLIWSGRRTVQNPAFNFLLEEANYSDLNAVQKRDWYEDSSDGFKNAIEGALLTAKPNGSRSAISFQRAELVMETFEEIPNMRIPTKISHLITSYIVDESSLVDESISKSRIGLVDYVRESFDGDLIVEIPTVIKLIASYVVRESAPEPRIRFVKLVMKILGNEDLGTRMATVVSQLILSYLSNESILESTATSFKKTIGAKRKYDHSTDENA